MTPVVGLIAPPLDLRPQAGEVAEIFELPLSLALDAGNYVRHDYEQDGRRGQYLSLTHQERLSGGDGGHAAAVAGGLESLRVKAWATASAAHHTPGLPYGLYCLQRHAWPGSRCGVS